jgi:glycine/D-amino acid oxidase-like deaminating enzyme
MTAHTRRRFIVASTAGLAGCAQRRIALPAVASPRIAKVHVAADRVIRSIAGLRPFRPSGFVVRAEKLDSKVVIHNYGHGGAGITLSWGTAKLAVDLAPPGAPQCAVIGCGVVGLSTARLLQERGFAPVIYAREMPPLTTSNVAGGLWEPTSLFDHDSVTPQFRRQFEDAARFAFRRYQSFAGDPYGVRWLPLYSLSRDSEYQAPSPESPNYEVEKLYPESGPAPHMEKVFGVRHVHKRQSMLIEPAIYLGSLIRDFHAAGGKIVIRDFSSAREIATLSEPLIFNCTGLGARTLFGDSELMPIRGQLVFLLPQPEVDYCTIGPGSTYMFPRHDGILLGGTFDRGVSVTEPDPAITARILRDNAALFDGMGAE